MPFVHSAVVGEGVGAIDGDGVGDAVGIIVGAGVGENVLTSTESATALDMDSRRAKLWSWVVNSPEDTAVTSRSMTTECTELSTSLPVMPAGITSGIDTSETTVTPTASSV